MAVPGQKIQIHDGLIEVPLSALSKPEKGAEEFLGAGSRHKVLLRGRSFVSVSRGDCDAFNIQVIADEGQEIGNVFRFGIIEKGAIDVDPKATFARGADCGDCTVEHALLTYRFVVVFPVPVEMDR